MKRFWIYIMLVPMLLWCAPCAFAADTVQCTETGKKVICNLSIGNFIKSAKGLLTNGWENTLQINIALLDGSGETVIMRSRLEATQRCYLDPFESPCLVLWRGASKYQKYKNEETFLKAMSRFGIQALTLTELPADNYIIRVSITVMASAAKRLRSIRTWFQQNTSDSGFLAGTGSLISSFLGSRAESAEADESYQITIDTAQFYIDLDFTPPAPDEIDEQNEIE